MWSSGIALIAAVLVVFPSAARSASTHGPTSTDCPSTSCEPPFCSLDYSQGGCPVCLCGDPRCKLEGCPDGQQCLPTGECDTCYECLPKFVTTAGPDTVEPSTVEPNTAGPTSTVCPSISCEPPLCHLHVDYNPWGCPLCLCGDPRCKLLGCPPGQQCLPTGECPTCYECLPKFDTSTNPPTTTSSECLIPPCAVGCRLVPGSDGCPTCDCTTHTCQEVTCDPGQDCVMQCPTGVTPCFPQPTCIPIIYETTTPCPLIRCTADCVTETGSDGCPRCNCPPTCQTVKCSAGYECRLVNVTCIRYPCFPQAQCVSTEETTTTKQCRAVRCLSTCFPGIGPDGCPSCDCPPTCQDYPCPDYEECVLQIVRCKDKKKDCFPQPTCIAKKRKQ